MSEIRLTPEQLEAIKGAKSPAEFTKLATDYGIEVTEESVKKLMDSESGELSDEQLEGVAGGIRFNWQRVLDKLNIAYGMIERGENPFTSSTIEVGAAGQNGISKQIGKKVTLEQTITQTGGRMQKL